MRALTVLLLVAGALLLPASAPAAVPLDAAEARFARAANVLPSVRVARTECRLWCGRRTYRCWAQAHRQTVVSGWVSRRTGRVFGLAIHPRTILRLPDFHER